MVDACIADYVQKMNDLGIETVGCCCGHGLGTGDVLIRPESESLLQQHGYSFTLYQFGLLRHEIKEK